MVGGKRDITAELAHRVGDEHHVVIGLAGQ
jgi:hypothetical protein